MSHRLERDGFSAEYSMDYYIGSGNQGRSYLVRIGDYLYQSPASYYSARSFWDMSPGYHRDRAPDFNRPVTAECLFCHSGRALPVRATLNRYEDPPFRAEAISCDRCHGSIDAHLREPSSANVVNPRKLPPRARDSVCEQCHLGGEARIPTPGRDFWDFRPGHEMEEILSVYLYERPPQTQGSKSLKVVSHAEQLAISVCAQESGNRMWCGSCHNPHYKPTDAAQYYRERCLTCHDTALLSNNHPGPSQDCVGCHMQRRQAYDGAHTAFTDHQILRRPAVASEPVESRNLVAWRTPPSSLAQRNLGLAYISVGERDQSAYHLNEGFRLLAEVQPSFPDDPEVLTSLGLVLLRKNVPRQAAGLFARVVRLQPEHASSYLNLGVAWKAAGDTQQAVKSLEQAIELDRSLEDAYVLLAGIYAETGRPDMWRRTMDRFLDFMPQNLSFRKRLAVEGKVPDFGLGRVVP